MTNLLTNNTISVDISNPNPAEVSGSSNIIGGTNTQLNTNENYITTNLFNWNTKPYFSNLPEQICGFNQLQPCSEEDCRSNIQRNCFVNPVFGDPSTYTNGPSYTNDTTSFYAVWPNYVPSWSIQKSNQKYFNPKVSTIGGWATVATITDNTYGLWYQLGQVPFNPTWSGGHINWGAVLNAFGPGIYRIVLQDCTGGSYASQATLNVVIPSGPFPMLVQGTFTIGAVNFSLYYTGGYTGYLNYLAALINTDGTYLAVVNINGITISGKNGNLSNNIRVSQNLQNTSEMFYANMDIAPINARHLHNDIRNATGNGSALVDNNPQPFSELDYNYGGGYNASTWKYTAGNDPVQTFAFRLTFKGSAVQAPYYAGGELTVWLCINGVRIISTQIVIPEATYGYPSQNGIITRYGAVFAPTDGIAGHPPRLRPGDIVTLRADCNTITTLNQPCSSDIGAGLGGSWWNNSSAYTAHVWGELEGGGPFVATGCSCAYASNPYLLMAWDCEKARGSVKFESYMSGTVADAYNKGNLFQLNGFTLYDSIRLGGFFGKMEPKHEKIMNEWGPSLIQPFGYMELVRDKIVETNKFTSKLVPYYVYKGLEYYAFMSPQCLVSDYNSVNANWDIMQMPVILKGDSKPTYMKPSFNKSWNQKNRLLHFEASFEDGIQGGIWSSCEI